VPTDHPGVNIGRRHFPLNAVFQNGPNSGKDVFMPLDWIIGGPAMAGQGWRMLMECLAAGRSISLPSSNTGMSKLAVRATGAYARVRSQFKTAIGRFEGIEEPLARMGGNLYAMDAARTMTAGAIDLGEKPSVVSAIVKYHVTERTRQVVNDAMDILGGKGICLGPNNFMGRAYQQMPVAITVEGANILTRSLIIFGQGAIRCHPYVLKEMAAARNPDAVEGLRDFDAAFAAHLGFIWTRGFRSWSMGLTGSNFAAVPSNVAPETRRYYQQLSRFSAAFAFLADVSMFVMGGDLKRKEKLSARLGDILSLMYLASATLKRYEAEGRQAEDAPLMHWAIWDAMFKDAERLRGRDFQLPEPLHRRPAALVHLPARPALRGALGQARPRGGALADRTLGHARPPHRRHVRAEGRSGCRRCHRARAGSHGGRRAGRAAHPQGGEGRKSRRRRHGDHGGPRPRSRHHHRRGARAAATPGRACAIAPLRSTISPRISATRPAHSRQRPVGCARLHKGLP
jgi:acyl-CoA dehydrogenase